VCRHSRRRLHLRHGHLPPQDRLIRRDRRRNRSSGRRHPDGIPDHD
jgi:hypothetical protein